MVTLAKTLGGGLPVGRDRRQRGGHARRRGRHRLPGGHVQREPARMAAARASLIEVLTPGAYEHLAALNDAHRRRLPARRRRAPPARLRARHRREGLRHVRDREGGRLRDVQGRPGRRAVRAGLALQHEPRHLHDARPRGGVDALRHAHRRGVDRYVEVFAELAEELTRLSAGASPFTAEHQDLRESIRRFVADELRPHQRVGGRALVSGRGLRPHGRARLPRAEVPGGVRRPGRRPPARRRAGRGAGGLRVRRGCRRIGAHIGIATPPIWKFGTEDQKARYLAPRHPGRADRGARGSPSPTPAPTWRRLRHERAAASTGAGTLNGSEDVHHERGCARRFSSPRSRRPPSGGHHGISFFIVDTGQPGLQA